MPPKKNPYSQLSRTAKHYRDNPASKKKKDAYNKEFNKKSEQRKKRSELSKIRRKAAAAGKNITGKDYDHKTKRFVSSSKNRGQSEKSRLKGSKRKKR